MAHSTIMLHLWNPCPHMCLGASGIGTVDWVSVLPQGEDASAYFPLLVWPLAGRHPHCWAPILFSGWTTCALRAHLIRRTFDFDGGERGP